MVTLDEALFNVQVTNGERKICCIAKEGDLPEDWVVKHENFCDTFMVVGALTGRGTLPLIQVPKNVKVNVEWYVKEVVRPLLEVHLRRLYPGEWDKMRVDHGRDPSHPAFVSQLYALDLEERLSAKTMNNSDIPAKSPHVSPIDFFGPGYLKIKHFHGRATTQRGLWKLFFRHLFLRTQISEMKQLRDKNTKTN